MTRRATVSGFALVSLAASYLVASGTAAGSSVPDAVARSLAVIGTDLFPIAADQSMSVNESVISGSQAVTIAQSNQANAGRATAYLGRLTDRDEESTPGTLAHVNRLVYVVVLEDVSVPLRGVRARGAGSAQPVTAVVRDVAFFVDALSGEPLKSVTL